MRVALRPESIREHPCFASLLRTRPGSGLALTGQLPEGGHGMGEESKVQLKLKCYFECNWKS